MKTQGGNPLHGILLLQRLPTKGLPGAAACLVRMPSAKASATSPRLDSKSSPSTATGSTRCAAVQESSGNSAGHSAVGSVPARQRLAAPTWSHFKPSLLHQKRERHHFDPSRGSGPIGPKTPIGPRDVVEQNRGQSPPSPRSQFHHGGKTDPPRYGRWGSKVQVRKPQETSHQDPGKKVPGSWEGR